MATINTVMNQKGDALQIPKLNRDGSEFYYNSTINDSTNTSVDITEGRGAEETIKISGSAAFMYSIIKGDSGSVAASTAQEFVAAGISVYINIPGATADTAAENWYIYLQSLSGPGNVAIMQVK